MHILGLTKKEAVTEALRCGCSPWPGSGASMPSDLPVLLMASPCNKACHLPTPWFPGQRRRAQAKDALVICAHLPRPPRPQRHAPGAHLDGHTAMHPWRALRVAAARRFQSGRQQSAHSLALHGALLHRLAWSWWAGPAGTTKRHWRSCLSRRVTCWMLPFCEVAPQQARLHWSGSMHRMLRLATSTVNTRCSMWGACGASCVARLCCSRLRRLAAAGMFIRAVPPC